MNATSMIVGLVALAGVGAGVYFFVVKKKGATVAPTTAPAQTAPKDNSGQSDALQWANFALSAGDKIADRIWE